ncbi:MAG TPA: hypothetical protein ENJ95_17000 [Bacteroidetes bacterium]|nr:hypothetical protein [Bacteroidota bacterium]
MELQLRPSLFRDVNVESIDLQKHRLSVIERITLRGRLEEFQALLQYYGRETVKNTLLQVRYLDKVTLSFCSTVFNVPITEFRCYKLAQSNPEHWNY